MGGQSNESSGSGDLEIQRRRFVSCLILAESLRNLIDLKSFLLAKRATIPLGWYSHWLRWLVKLDLVVSHSLDALFKNLGSLPSLQALNLPAGPYPPSLLDAGTITVSKSNECLEDAGKNHRFPNFYSNLGSFLASGKEIYNPKLPEYEQLYRGEGFPGVPSPKSLEKCPAVLQPHNPLWKKGSPSTNISISCRANLEDDRIEAIKKKCREWLKSGIPFLAILQCNLVSKELDRLDIIFDQRYDIDLLAYNMDRRKIIVIIEEPQRALEDPQGNLVSKELDRLDIIFNQRSGIDLLAYKMDRRNIIVIIEEPQRALEDPPLFFLEKAPPQRAMYSVFLIYHGPDVRRTFIPNLLKSLSCGGVYVVNIDLNKWEIERGNCPDLEQGWDGTDIHIPIISRHYEDSFSRHLGEFLRMCRSQCIIKPLFYEAEQTDILEIRILYESCFSVLATPVCSTSGEINEVSPSRAGRPPQMSFQTGWSLSDYR